MTPDTAMTPDTKDWTWVLQRPCPECGFVAAELPGPGVAGAIAHIGRYGSHHTDAIVAEDAAATDRFLREVDSAIVLHNTSTQFADGGEFGFGAEIGIATGRLHARGPVGLVGLTTYKTVVRGDGQIRAA